MARQSLHCCATPKQTGITPLDSRDGDVKGTAWTYITLLFGPEGAVGGQMETSPRISLYWGLLHDGVTIPLSGDRTINEQ
jgi:hypothetical protein